MKKFELLNYDDFSFGTINSKNTRTKRDSATIESPVLETNRLYFEAFGRKFEIYLKRDTNLVADNIDIEVRGNKGKSQHINDFFTSNYYSGFVDGVANSYVICYFEKESDDPKIGPLIYAKVYMEKTSYYIEPVIGESKNHSYIIYSSKDIDSDVISNESFKY